MQAIQAYATGIRIPFLLHFTRVGNLPTIMTHGLYPVARAHEVGVVPEVNDTNRFDRRTNGTSLSIALPNCKMFYRYRMDNPEVDWAVLVLDPAVLWTKKCAFCRHNAADNRISRQPLSALTTLQAFVGMFEEIEGDASREEQSLKPFDPTDVQAEVLVMGVVEPEYILHVVFEKSSVRDAYAAHLGNRGIHVHKKNKGVFASRGYVRKAQ